MLEVQRALEVKPFQEVPVAHPGGGSSDRRQNQAEASLLLSVSIIGKMSIIVPIMTSKKRKTKHCKYISILTMEVSYRTHITTTIAKGVDLMKEQPEM